MLLPAELLHLMQRQQTCPEREGRSGRSHAFVMKNHKSLHPAVLQLLLSLCSPTSYTPFICPMFLSPAGQPASHNTDGDTTHPNSLDNHVLHSQSSGPWAPRIFETWAAKLQQALQLRACSVSRQAGIAQAQQKCHTHISKGRSPAESQSEGLRKESCASKEKRSL